MIPATPQGYVTTNMEHMPARLENGQKEILDCSK